MLDEIEKRLLAPLNVVEQHHDRRLLFEELAERPGDLVRRVSLRRRQGANESPPQPTGRWAVTPSCFTTSTTGQ